MNYIQKVIARKHPGYDFERYRFDKGDIVKTLDGALICVEYSAIDYVSAFPITRSMKVREKCWQRISYDDLPYYKIGEFKSIIVKPTDSIKWKVGDIVRLEYGGLALLIEEDESTKQTFTAYVIEDEDKYYLHTKIYLENPMKNYFN